MEKIETPILYGFVIAVAGTLLMLSLIGLNLLGPTAISSDREMIGGSILFLMLYLFLLIGIYFVLKSKKKHNNNRISFKGALLQGFILSLSAAFTSVILTYLFYEVLYPKYVTDLLHAMELKMNLLGIPENKIDEKLNEKLFYYSTFVQASYSFIGNLVTGITYTLLLSFFLKTNK